MSRPSGLSPEKLPILTVATEYVRRGWSPLPIPFRSKNPGFDDWQHLRLAEADLAARFNGRPQNIGILLGEPSGGLIDIDLDHSRAVELAPKYLPPTSAVFGRASKRNSHWLYRVSKPLETEKFRSKTQGMIVEIRSTGSQTVFPPSTHEEGELIEWEDQEAEPALIEPETLKQVVTQLADAVFAELGEKRFTRRGTLRRPLAPVDPQYQSGHDPSKCLEAMLDLDLVDQKDGSFRLLAAARLTVEHGLADEQAVATIRRYESEKPFPKSWTDVDILQRVRDAEKRTQRGAALAIANYEVVQDPDDENSKPILVPRSMNNVIEDIYRLTGGWPRRVDNVLFVNDQRHGIDWFDRRTTAGLFGWLRTQCHVDWKGSGKFVSQAELFAELERTAHRYNSVELLPHEPPIDGFYYRCGYPKPGDGTHLSWLIDRFRPATPVDRDLIRAAIMTSFWGGPAGCRPAFVITSDDGRGVGKTKLAEIIAQLAGGSIDVSAGEDIATLKQRLLSPEGQTKRIAVLDNVKTLRLSWADLEALVTTPIISGKRLYVGEGQRPNVLTWLLTLNGVSLATDMAQRSVIIKLVKGKNDGPWYEDTMQYIDNRRDEIIGDVIASLRGEQFQLPDYSRWSTWEKDVLSRLPEPGETQRVILERQGEANCEQEEAEIIEDYFVEQLVHFGYCPQSALVRIPVSIAAYWYGKAIGEPVTTPKASKRLHQMSGEGQLKRLVPEPGRTHGRCFIWTGPAADVVNQTISNDLASRIAAELADGKDG